MITRKIKNGLYFVYKDNNITKNNIIGAIEDHTVSEPYCVKAGRAKGKYGFFIKPLNKAYDLGTNTLKTTKMAMFEELLKNEIDC